MENAELSWYIVDKKETNVITNEYFVGTFTPITKDITFVLQLWNNRFGQTKIQDINNGVLSIQFDTIEDSKLLDFCQIKIDNDMYQPLNVSNNKGTLPINRVLSGEINMGEEDSLNNYVTIHIRFSNISNYMKNGLKNMIIDLSYLS